jgi:predicted GNAT family acetyltransferase
VTLGDADLDAMVDLVERTQPGPFLPGTPMLGRYAGVRENGALVAMAGERLHPPGHVEVSAVCTDPAHRGRGLAAALVADIAAGIHARDEVPMLHVRADNESAIRLYLAMGFTARRRFDGIGLRAPVSSESRVAADG